MSKADIHRTPDKIDLSTLLEQHEWSGGVLLVVQGAMRAPVVNGSIQLEASWRADVFLSRRERRPLFTLVAETTEQLFKDLAAMSVEGELTVSR